MNKKMDQIKTGTIIVLVLIIVFGGSYFASELKSCDNHQAESTGQVDLTTIGIDEYLSLKQGSEASIIYIARPTCTYCQKQEPIMKNIAFEYGITVNYLNTDELDDEAHTKLLESDEYFAEGYGTPLTLIVKDNQIIDKKEGLSTKEDLVALFKEYNLIKE